MVCQRRTMQRTTLAFKWGQKVATDAGWIGRLRTALMAPRSDRVTHLLVKRGLFGGAAVVSLDGATQHADGTLLLGAQTAGSGRPKGAVPFSAKTQVHRKDDDSLRISGLVLDIESHAITNLLVGGGRNTRVVPATHFQKMTTGSPSTSLDAAQLEEFLVHRADNEAQRSAAVALIEAGLADGYSAVQVRVISGIAHLTGKVSFPLDAEDAEEAVRHVRGILSVETHLLSDRDLEVAAAEAMAMEGVTRQGLVLTRSLLGRVALSGYLDSMDHIARAVRLVESVPGVRSVEHDIVVRTIPVAAPAPETDVPPAGDGEAEAEETP